MGCGASSHSDLDHLCSAALQLPCNIEPLPVLAEDHCRLVVATVMPYGFQVMSHYKLNPVFADTVLNNSCSGNWEFPPEANEQDAWKPARCAFWEEYDGLRLHLGGKFACEKATIVPWSGSHAPRSNLFVKEMPKIHVHGLATPKSTSGTVVSHVCRQLTEEPEADKPMGRVVSFGREHKCAYVEVIEIDHHEADEDGQNILTLSPFAIRWEANGRTRCHVIGCDDENTCRQWVSQIKLYRNIVTRHCGALMWKLRRPSAEALSSSRHDREQHMHLVADLQNWRRRICYLEELITPRALCMRYVSENLDAEQLVSNVLVNLSTREAEVVSCIRQLSAIELKELTAAENDHMKRTLRQYDEAVARHWALDDEVQLPLTLYGFEVSQPDESYGGHVFNMYAFEDPQMCESWLAHIDCVSRMLTRGGKTPVMAE